MKGTDLPGRHSQLWRSPYKNFRDPPPNWEPLETIQQPVETFAIMRLRRQKNIPLYR